MEAATPGLEKEIIVVDDASTDSTRGILKGIAGIKLILNERNRGKGAAVIIGLGESTGDLIIIQDGDLEYDPDFYKDMLNPILEGRAEVVFGSRFINTPREARNWHYRGNKILTAITNLILGTNLTDEATCYKLMSKTLMRDLALESEGFDIDIEITVKVVKKGYRIYEVPISYAPRGRKEGKKIRLFYDGAKTLFKLLKFYYFS